LLFHKANGIAKCLYVAHFRLKTCSMLYCSPTEHILCRSKN